MWLSWWKNKCLLLIGEQPSTIGILGENNRENRGYPQFEVNLILHKPQSLTKEEKMCICRQVGAWRHRHMAAHIINKGFCFYF